MTVPLREPLPNIYLVRAVSDRWLSSDYQEPLRIAGIILPDMHPPHTGS